MALADYVRILRRRWWIPALLVTITVLTTGLFLYGAAPTYSATATVFAGSPGNGSNRSVTFQQAATSNTLAVSVIKKFNLGMSVEQLASEIQVSTTGPNLYSVTVTDRDARLAAHLAQQVAADSVVLYRQLAAQLGISSGDQLLLQVRDILAKSYDAALTARLQFQAQHPSAFNPNAPITDVAVSAKARELQVEENTASTIYQEALAEVDRQGLDQASSAQSYNAFVLDLPTAARRNTQLRVPEIAFAAAVAIVLGIGLAFLLEHFAGTSLAEAEAVEGMIGAPVIGIIPRANPQALRRTFRGTG